MSHHILNFREHSLPTVCISIFNWCSLLEALRPPYCFGETQFANISCGLHLKIELFSCVSKTKDSSRLFQRIQIFKGSFINTIKKTHIQWLHMLHLNTLKFIMSAKLKSGKLRKIENCINNYKRGNIKIYSTHILLQISMYFYAYSSLPHH